MKKLLLIILLLQLTSCKLFKPSGLFLSQTTVAIPEGTPAFQQGFKDGCNNALYSRGNHLYRHTHEFDYDPAMTGNSEYRFGHGKGYGYCFLQVVSPNTGISGSWDRVIHPYGYDPTFSTGDIGGAWDGMFRGTGSLAQKFGGDVGGFVGVLSGGEGGGVFSANPLWAGGSKGQIFGQ